MAARRGSQGVNLRAAGCLTARSDRLCRVNLLHLVAPSEWRAALAAGAIHPTVAEFVHLSTPEQVAVAANGHYAGRNDLYLLVLDPERIDVEVRWEESEPPMHFPHAYGPVPTAAVLDVLPYPPADGVFATPTLPPMDPAARAARLSRLDRAPDGDRRRARRGRGGAAHRARAVLLPAQRALPRRPRGRRDRRRRGRPRPRRARPPRRGAVRRRARRHGHRARPPGLVGRRAGGHDRAPGRGRPPAGSSRSTSPPSARSGTTTGGGPGSPRPRSRSCPTATRWRSRSSTCATSRFATAATSSRRPC